MGIMHSFSQRGAVVVNLVLVSRNIDINLFNFAFSKNVLLWLQSFLFNIKVKLLCPKGPFYTVTHLVHAYVLLYMSHRSRSITIGNYAIFTDYFCFIFHMCISAFILRHFTIFW